MKYKMGNTFLVVTGIAIVLFAINIFAQNNEQKKNTQNNIVEKLPEKAYEEKTKSETESGSIKTPWISCTYYNPNGDAVYVKERELDQNKNVISSSIRYIDGVPESGKTIYTLDNNGNRVSGISYLPNGEEDGNSTKYSVDEHGNITKVLWLDEQGTITWIDSYTYDDYSNEITHKTISPNGEIIKDTTTSYVYDQNKRIIRSETLSNLDTEESKSENRYTEYEYDKSGRLCKETIFKTNGTMQGWQTYEYE